MYHDDFRRKKKSSLSIEECACLNGFRAAVQKLSRYSNPHKNVWLDQRRHKWWYFGWVSYHQKCLPQIIIKKLCFKLGLEKFQKIQEQFQKTGKLPKEAIDLLKEV